MGFPSGVELHVEVAADSEGRNASPPPHAIPSPSIALQLLAQRPHAPTLVLMYHPYTTLVPTQSLSHCC